MSFAQTFLTGVKTTIFPVNRQLLMLKTCFFLSYAAWICILPFATLLSTKIVSTEQLAITFTSIPLSSVLGPIFTGFLGDKFGNYKIVLIFLMLLGGFSHWIIIWLPHDYELFRANKTFTTDCSNISSDSSDDSLQCAESTSNAYAFPVLIIIRIFGYFAVDSANMLIDSSGLSLCKEHGGEFGKQKMWCNFAFVIVPIIIGSLIDLISGYRGFKDYSVAFYVGLGCAIAVTPIVFQMNVTVEKNKRSLLKTARAVVGMVDVDMFFLAEVVLGICWGWHMNFFSVYTDVELKTSKTLLGASWSISGIGCMIVMFLTKPLIDRLGAANLVALALMTYALRFICYSFLSTPWVILIIEAFDGLCGFLGMVAGNLYCVTAAPSGMLASLNGILYAALFGVGRVIGTAVGGIIMAGRDSRFTYLVYGILSGCTSILYFTIYHLFLKKIERTRLSESIRKDAPNGITNVAADLHEEDPKMVPPIHQECKRTEPSESTYL